ncbi:MAG TPA: isocitrate/isopropylmalate family dehydrogenase [Bacteroidales bacterium]|jgi:isocitrate dehydrogenase (NAD+)|nr:isocitrate/isopropylmalate dehydrogenase family protein [Bacteroidales bacterium]HOF46567.1 isocitrate/isopropylmalate family dehydrogenase [Bacteroidales bacterium]HOS57179.1 isocitrate/isopropylmalate family dehydrogenase [Bacteroidales bacterium]HPY81244.1 isocitrate/isopropylmalate family dehydrogenase [Bacteroidales bacterium]HQA85955.1 isocitrate/isopropylmalate family dehydrogenase [Bacteroidales bacterium]
MSKRTIVAMPGDGIGKIVLEECIRLLDAAGFEADYVNGDIGWDFWCKEGNPLPARTIELLEKHKIGLFGAITSKPKDKAEAELAPELRNKGLVYFSPIVTMRQRFKMDICMRPCKAFKGNPLNFIRRTADGGFEEPLVDTMVFRQNTEGLYGGVEWSNAPDIVWDAMMTHKNFEKNFSGHPRNEVFISTRILTKKYSERILRAAFDYAKERNLKGITVCEKPNVIRETSGMILKLAQDIAKKDYPEISVWDTNIDAQMMWLTKNPEDYNVVVSTNMFGDILSDGFAGLVGGLGFASSAQFGESGVAVFEPTHGSAPKYADYEIPIVNPIAMFLSACMMLDYIGEKELSQKIQNAIATVIKEGKVRTYDMMKLRGSQDVIHKGAASTKQMTDAVIAKL